MSRILSDDEVAALLRGIDRSEGRAAAAEPATSSVRALDLAGRERDLRGRWPGLERVLERFAHGLEQSLATSLAVEPVVRVAALELVEFGRLVATLPQPAVLHLVRLAPLRGHALLVLSPALAATLLEVVFGGRVERSAAIAARGVSSIGRRALERLVVRLLPVLAEAWRPLVPLDVTLAGSETDARLARVAGVEELVVAADLHVDLEGVAGASLVLCIPDAALDPVRRRLQADAVNASADAGWSDRLRAVLADAPLEVSADLGSRQLSLREVIALRVGDVIPLGTGREGPVVVRVEGRPCFVGAPGLSGSMNAVRVTAPVDGRT